MMAIVLIGLTGIAITALASLFAVEIQRTRQTVDDGQLRQLLLAATHITPPPNGQEMDVALPEQLVQHGGSLHLRAEAAGGEVATVHVEARWNSHMARETLIYRGGSNGLVLYQALLDE
jgi:hypothetical protein